jgi:hypothetical protein
MPYDKWEVAGLIKSRVCPRRLVTPESRRWLALFQHYQAGFMAQAGGVLDQSARYLEAMRIISGVIDRG